MPHCWKSHALAHLMMTGDDKNDFNNFAIHRLHGIEQSNTFFMLCHKHNHDQTHIGNPTLLGFFKDINPHRLMMPLSVKGIFLSADFYQIDNIFLELSEMFYADLRYGLHYQRILIEYRRITHPMTTGLIDKMSKYFQTTTGKIIIVLGHNFISIHKLKKHFRSSN